MSLIPPPDPSNGDDILPWARSITRLLRQIMPRESADVWPEIGTTGTKYLLRRRPGKKGAGNAGGGDELPCWIGDATYGAGAGYDPAVHYVWLGEGSADFVTAAGCPIARFELDVEDPERTKLSLISGSLDSAADGLFLGTQWATGGYGYNLSYADGLLATYTREQLNYVAASVTATDAQLHGYANNEAFSFLAKATPDAATHTLSDATAARYLGLTVDDAQAQIYGYTPAFSYETLANATEAHSRLWSDTLADYLETSVTTGETTILGYATDEAWNFRLKALNSTGEVHLALFDTASANFAEIRVEDLLSQVRGYTALGFEYLIKADDGESSATLFDDSSANYLQSKVVTNDASVYGYAASGAFNFRLRAHDTADPVAAAALQLWTAASVEYLLASAAAGASGISGYTDDGAFKYYLGATATAASVTLRTAEDADYAHLKVTTATGGELRCYHTDEKNNLKYVDGSLQVWGKVDDANDIYVYLDLRDVETIKAANADADLNIKFREIDVCDKATGEDKKQIFLCSAMYDPPA